MGGSIYDDPTSSGSVYDTGTTTEDAMAVGDNRVAAGEGGIFGLVTNAFRDLGDIAGGIGVLGGTVANDVFVNPYRETLKAVGLHDDDVDYSLDDMYGAITGTNIGTQGKTFEQQGSALANVYQDYYGPEHGLTGGHFSRLYENPLQIIGDALTVATAGGYGAAKGAQFAGTAGKLGLASKLAETGETLSSVGKLGLTGKAASAADVTSGFGTASTITRAAAPTADDVSRLGKFVNTVEGSARRIFNPTTGQVEIVNPAFNPARRLLYQDVYQKLISRSTSWTEAQAKRFAELAEHSDNPATAMRYAEKAQRYQDQLNKAIAGTAGRIYRPAYSGSKARKWVDFTVGQATGKGAQVTDDVARAYDESLGLLDEDVVGTHELADSVQGTDASITHDGIVAQEGRGTRRSEQLDTDTPETQIQDVPWAGAQAIESPNRGIVEDLERVIGDPAEGRMDAGVMGENDAASQELYQSKLDFAKGKGTAEDIGSGVYKVEGGNRDFMPEAGRMVSQQQLDSANKTMYYHVDDTGKVDGYREVYGDGRVSAVSYQQKQGIGSKLIDAHWADKGISTPQAAKQAIEAAGTMSGPGRALNRSKVRRMFGATDEGYSSEGRFVPDEELTAIKETGAARLASDPAELGVKLKNVQVSDVLPRIAEDWAGGTFDAKTGKLVDFEDGFTGGVVPEHQTIKLDNADATNPVKVADAVRRAEEKFAAELSRPDRYLGVFRDAKTGKTTFEPAIHVATREEAEAIATHLDSPGGFYDHASERLTPEGEPGEGVFPAKAGVPTNVRVPAEGTPGRGALDGAIEQARKDTVELTPKLRNIFGDRAKVIFGGAKDLRSIRRKAELMGQDWSHVDDISRFRIVAEDAWTGQGSRDIIEKVKKATGGKVKRIENSIGNPDASDGSRGLRVVVEMPDGHPVEFSILTPSALKVRDATKNLTNAIQVMTAMRKRGLDVPVDRIVKAQRLSQQLWEGVTDEMREALGGPAASRARRAHNDFRVAVWGKMTDPLLDRGVSIDSAFDNAYAPLRYKHGATHDEAGKGLTGGPSPLQLDDALAKSGDFAPMYYPQMDASLMAGRGDFLRKGTTGIASPGQDVNLKRNTGKVIAAAKQSKDVKEVYRIRAAQQGKLQERMDVLFNTVQEYGHPLDNINDYDPSSEVLFAPGLVKRFAAQHNMMLDVLAQDPTGKGLGDLLDVMEQRNLDELKKVSQDGGDIEAFAVPKVVAERLREHTKWIADERIDIFFGTPTAIWKSMVLSARPAWMTNNLLGNVTFLKLQGGRLTDVAKQLSPKYLRRLREAIGEPQLEGVEGGMYSSLKSVARQYDPDTVSGRFANAMQRNTTQRRGGKWASRYSNWAQRMNSSMEDAFRRASYMTAAEKEMTRGAVRDGGRSFWRSKQRMEDAFRVGLDEKSYARVVDEVDKALNNYSTMSPIARNIVRPYLMPFWAFYRHAAKTLLAMPFDHPAKARVLALINEANDERMRAEGIDPGNMPGWMKGGSLFMGKGDAGDYRFMSTAGVNPFNSVLQSPLNTLTPAAKILYEQTTGRSTFTGQPFSDPNVMPGGAFSQNSYRIEKDAAGNPQPIPVTGTRPGLMEHMLQQIPQYEMVKDLIAGGSTYDTSTLLDVLKFRLGDGADPVLRDPDTGKPYTPRDLEGFLGRLLGFTSYDTDLEGKQERVLDEKAAALKAWLEKQDAAAASSPTTGSIYG